MADKRTLISAIDLRGPAGSVPGADKRTLISRIQLTGAQDKRTLISRIQLVPPNGDLRTIISRIQLVGPVTNNRASFYGPADEHAWVPVDWYIPPATGSVWDQVT